MGEDEIRDCDRWAELVGLAHIPTTIDRDCLPGHIVIHPRITATEATSPTKPKRPIGISAGLAFGLLVTIQARANSGVVSLYAAFSTGSPASIHPCFPSG